jgi:hypothetical protein
MINNPRILAVISFFAGVLFVICFGVQAFIFERLDPNGVPDRKQNEIRWAEYASEVRIYKVLVILSLLIAIYCAIAAIIATRRRGVAD